jgi:hypothetical protein
MLRDPEESEISLLEDGEKGPELNDSTGFSRVSLTKILVMTCGMGR